MSTFDLWTQEYCLACDKQVHIDGAAYCSEACRLADYEKTSAPSSQPSSPGFAPSSYSSSTTSPPTSMRSGPAKFYLSPAYDFSDAQPYGTTPPRKSYYAPRSGQTNASASNGYLSPSSSHSSLCSMHSNCSTGDAEHLSAKARKELQAYAVSFEQVRLQRRRSY